MVGRALSVATRLDSRFGGSSEPASSAMTRQAKEGLDLTKITYEMAARLRTEAASPWHLGAKPCTLSQGIASAREDVA